MTLHRVEPYRNLDREITFRIRPLTIESEKIVVVIDDRRDPIIETIDETPYVSSPKWITLSLRQADYDSAKNCLPAPKVARISQ